jgi:membrane protease YdiL (CAAX protease family)
VTLSVRDTKCAAYQAVTRNLQPRQASSALLACHALPEIRRVRYHRCNRPVDADDSRDHIRHESSATLTNPPDATSPPVRTVEPNAYSRQSLMTLFSQFPILVIGPALIGIAEFAIAFASLVVGTVIHAIVLNGLVLQYIGRTTAERADTRMSAEQQSATALLLLLAQLPLLRILSLSMPNDGIAEPYWYALVGAPSLIGIVMAARVCGFRPADIGLRRRIDTGQLFIAVTGVPFGIVGYVVSDADARTSFDSWGAYLLGAIFLCIFVGFLEGLLLRGLLQQAASGILGRAGFIWSGVLFTLMYLGTESWTLIPLMALSGLLWGWWVDRTQALTGTIMAHSIMVVTMLIVLPAIL